MRFFSIPSCFSASSAIYKQRASLKLDPEALAAGRVRLRAICPRRGEPLRGRQGRTEEAERRRVDACRMPSLTKLLAATKNAAFVTTDKNALAGIEPPLAWKALRRPRRIARSSGYVIPLQNTTQQPDLGVSERAVDAAGDFREFVESRRTWRCERYARHRCPPGAVARAEGEAARLSDLRRLEAGRPDGEDSRSGAEIHGRAGAGRHGTQPLAKRKIFRR